MLIRLFFSPKFFYPPAHPPAGEAGKTPCMREDECAKSSASDEMPPLAVAQDGPRLSATKKSDPSSGGEARRAKACFKVPRAAGPSFAASLLRRGYEAKEDMPPRASISHSFMYQIKVQNLSAAC